MLFVAVDANFRLKNQLVSNFSQDPGLGIGWAYMLPREGYEKYVLSRTKDGDVSNFDLLSLSLADWLSRFRHVSVFKPLLRRIQNFRRDCGTLGWVGRSAGGRR
jgi:hypothetical protein